MLKAVHKITVNIIAHQERWANGVVFIPVFESISCF